MTSRHSASAEALLSRPPLFNLPFLQLLRTVYSAISPALPSDLVTTPFTPSPLPPPAVPVHYSTDEAHGGRVVVPNTLGASIPLSDVLSAPHPVAYVREYLLYSAKYTPHNVSNETVFFSPGLNTVLEPMEGELASITRLDHYARMLAGFPIASIHTGSSFDQGEVEVTLPWWLRWVAWVLPESMRGVEVEGGKLRFGARNIDAMQTSLSFFNVWDTPLKKSFRDIMEMTKSDNATDVVLMVYSRASVAFDAALRQYLDEKRDGERKDDVRKRLAKYLTVVTIGNASRWYQDGPKYIHLAAWRDSLTNRMGVNGKWKWRGGKNAVYLNCNTPWNPDAFDNHNFSASTCQYLAVVMEVNGVKGFKDLWEKGQTKDGLKEPEEVDKVVNAMIKVTEGAEYLWDKETPWKGVDPNVFPSREEAMRIIKDKVGVKFAEALEGNFPTK